MFILGGAYMQYDKSRQNDVSVAFFVGIKEGGSCLIGECPRLWIPKEEVDFLMCLLYLRSIIYFSRESFLEFH